MEKRQGRDRFFPSNSRTARNSTIWGITMLVGWIFPLLGLPLGLAGLSMGISGLSSSRRDLARAGIFLNGLGLGLTVLNIFLSFYLVKTGKLDSLLMLQ